MVFTSQASLPSAPAQMDEDGRTKFGPNWVRNAAWHLASSHKGTSISFKITECVPSIKSINQNRLEMIQNFSLKKNYPLIYDPIRWRHIEFLPSRKLGPDVAYKRHQYAAYVWPAGRSGAEQYRWLTTNYWIADEPWREKHPVPHRPAVRLWRWHHIHPDGLWGLRWYWCWPNYRHKVFQIFFFQRTIVLVT